VSRASTSTTSVSSGVRRSRAWQPNPAKKPTARSVLTSRRDGGMAPEDPRRRRDRVDLQYPYARGPLVATTGGPAGRGGGALRRDLRGSATHRARPGAPADPAGGRLSRPREV